MGRAQGGQSGKTVSAKRSSTTDAAVRTASHSYTVTGHIVGGTYISSYWGGMYKVIGPAETGFGPGVEVECVTPSPGGGAHNRVGDRWTHCTALSPRDQLVDITQ